MNKSLALIFILVIAVFLVSCSAQNPSQGDEGLPGNDDINSVDQQMPVEGNLDQIAADEVEIGEMI